MTSRNGLNRSAYVDAALEVIGAVGVDKLSMRNVAARLNVSPMAMYKHFPTKDDLLAASLEEFIARANVIPDHSLPWEQWVEQLARRMYQALCRDLSWVPLLGSLPVGVQAIAVTDAFVEKLCAAGFSVEQSLRAYFAIVQVVVGAVCLRSSLDSNRATSAKGDDDRASVTHSFLEQVNRGRGLSKELESFLKQDQIELGLPLIIDALRAQRVETPL
jgi:AcrR family transcriptional regulator